MASSIIDFIACLICHDAPVNFQNQFLCTSVGKQPRGMQPEDTPTAMARFLSARFRREIFGIVDEVFIKAIAMSPITMASTDNNYSIFSSATVIIQGLIVLIGQKALVVLYATSMTCQSYFFPLIYDTVWAEGT
jgi:hypothetical protein